MRHQFLLDDADLTGSSLAVRSAGGGLPRRITGNLDFASLVNAGVAPAGWWRLDDAAGAFQDSSVNARHLTISNEIHYTRRVAGHVLGGGVNYGLATAAAYNTVAKCTAGGVYPEHTLTAGVPMAWLGFARSPALIGFQYFITTQATPLTVSRGYSFLASTSGSYVYTADGSAAAAIYAANGVSQKSVAALADGRWHCYWVRYSGGTITSPASWMSGIDDLYATCVAGGRDPLGAGSPAVVHSAHTAYTARVQECADVLLWRTSIPTAEQLCALGSAALGRARFHKTFDVPVTVRGVSVPGSTINTNDGTAQMDQVAAWVSVDGVTRTQVRRGEDPAYAVQRGQTLYVDVDMSHNSNQTLPFVADASGQAGPVLDYDAPDILVPSGAVASTVKNTTRVIATVEG